MTPLIILYNPWSTPSHKKPLPMSLLAVAAVLEGEFDYEIVDANLLPDPVAHIVELGQRRPLLAIGITVMPGPQLNHAVPDAQRLKAALDRLQATTVATSIRQPSERRQHRFSWINEWKERLDAKGRPLGIELIVPDWFYEGVLNNALVLTIDRNYFDLFGGIERWLYRLVRKHGGRQPGGWSFDFHHLHAKSGSLSRFSNFACDLRDIVRRQPLPGYRLRIDRLDNGRELLVFAPATPLLSARSREAVERL